MAETGLELNVFTYSLILSWFCKNGRVDDAIELLNKMSSTRVAPNLVCYTEVITALCQADRHLEAEQLFSKMLEGGLIPDLVLLTVVKNLLGGHETRLVRKTLQAIAKKVSHGCQPSVTTYNFLIRRLKASSVDSKLDHAFPRSCNSVTEECLKRAISVCKDGASFKKIGKRISEHAERFGYGVVERFVGHGVGTVFHSEPIIIHNRNDKSGCMVEGETFTIEPILTVGSIDCVAWDDGWTTLTADGSLAAQFEHTILITRTGAEVLTKC